MQISLQSGSPLSTPANALLTFIALQDDDQLILAPEVADLLASPAATGDLSGRANEIGVFYPQEVSAPTRLITVGLGKASAITSEALRQASASAIRRARALKCERVSLMLPNLSLRSQDAARAIAEGALMGAYQYHGQKSSEKPIDIPAELVLVAPSNADIPAITQGIAIGSAFAEGSLLARDLANLPPNICTPAYLAEQSLALRDEVGLSVTVLERQQMAALRMGALLAVAQGSDAPPRFIIMEHKPAHLNDEKPIVLVGKAVTFDTGGYSLKTRDGMATMKMDMSGGAAVIGAMKTIARLNLPRHIVGLVPASDNMVSGNAYRPQEVITASNGKTIEIISTDAEGRMLLADALVYATRYQPAAVLDIATLTGGAVVALGAIAAACFSTDDALFSAVEQAGQAVHERVWRLPLYPEYHKMIESDTADMKNSAGSPAGSACVAAVFLSNFVDFPWVHIDMAGMASTSGDNPYAPKTASGWGARLLSQYIANASQ